MTKRVPFGRHDANVRSSAGSATTSSLPSLAEALQLKRRKKKKKKAARPGDDTKSPSFLIDSTSKTPRISNLSSKPPRHGATKHLRRLAQSAARRTQSQEHVSPEYVAFGDKPVYQEVKETTQQSNSTSGVKRQGHEQEKVASKRLKDTTRTTEREAQNIQGPHEMDHATSMTDDAHDDYSSKAKELKNLNEQAVASHKGTERKNVAAEYLHKDRASSTTTRRPDLLVAFDDLDLPPPQESLDKDELSDHTNADNEMDCDSDENSLGIMDEDSTGMPSPPQADDVEVADDPDWKLVPPSLPQRPVAVVEAEETEGNHKYGCRVMSSKDPEPAYHGRASRPTMRDETMARFTEGGPVVTKDMLDRVRRSKADNKVALDALLSSEAPRSSPEASIIGTTIEGESLERVTSWDGSDMTLSSTEHLLYGTPSRVTRLAHMEEKETSEPRNDDCSVSPEHEIQEEGYPQSIALSVEKYEDKRGAVNEESQKPSTIPAVQIDRVHRASPTHSIREPQGGANERSQMIHFEHDGVMYAHEPLPPGWIVRMSKTKLKPYYHHPDHGTTWHCPTLKLEMLSSLIIGQRSVAAMPVGSVKTTSNEQDNEVEISDNARNDIADMTSETESNCQASAKSDLAVKDAGRDINALELDDSKFEQLSTSASIRTELSTNTEAILERKLSPVKEEEVVSTVQFSRRESGAVASIDAGSEEELKSTKILPNKAGLTVQSSSPDSDGSAGSVSSPIRGNRLDYDNGDDMDVSSEKGLQDAESYPVNATKLDRGEHFEVDIEACNKEHAPASHTSGASGTEVDVSEGRSETGDILPDPEYIEITTEMYDEDVTAEAEPDEKESKADGSDSGYGHGESGEQTEMKPRTSEEHQQASEVQLESEAADKSSLAADEIGGYDEDVLVSAEKAGLEDELSTFEEEVGTLVFGRDHGDVELSPQVKRLSPIEIRDSFDCLSEAPVDDQPESDDKVADHMIVDGSPSSRPSSPTDYNNFDISVQAGNDESSRNDLHGDVVSIGSTVTGETALGSQASIWKGWSSRVLHPPHPLDSLINVEALIKAAMRRAKRRKSGTSRKRKSSSRRKGKRKTVTRLFFD